MYNVLNQEKGYADAIRIPSLTRTFLQNRLWANAGSSTAVAVCDRERSRRTKSVIQINVCSPPASSGIASTAENCTIVTIGGDGGGGGGNDSAPPSTVVRFEEQSSRKKSNNSIVRVNVVAATTTATATAAPQEPPLYANCESAEESSASTSTSTSTTTCASSYDSSSPDADFSLHYMSCRIDGRLTEHEVGLAPDDEAGGAEPIYEEIAEVATVPPPLPSKPPPDKDDHDGGGIFIPPRSIFEGASKYDILTYLAGAKERCRIPAEVPRFVIDDADADVEELQQSRRGADGAATAGAATADSALQSPPHSCGGGAESVDFSRRISHLSSVSDSSDELACFLACVAANSGEKVSRIGTSQLVGLLLVYKKRTRDEITSPAPGFSLFRLSKIKRLWLYCYSFLAINDSLRYKSPTPLHGSTTYDIIF